MREFVVLDKIGKLSNTKLKFRINPRNTHKKTIGITA